jgi:energy-coupling factor transport system ATP-binding protein
MSSTGISVPPRELCGELSKINVVSFSIHYPKFSFSADLNFSPGIHVIYGESGAGKSWLVHALAGTESDAKPNFELSDIRIPDKVQTVFQNPEDQIIADTIFREIAFGFECQSSDVSWIQQKVKNSAALMPEYLDLSRHPSTLSGGEMEQLNLITAFGADSNLVLIDDGLSFLTHNAKENWVKRMRNFIQKRESAVLWFTSNPLDISYGDTAWHISQESFRKHEEHVEVHHKKGTIPKGEMEIRLRDLQFAYSGGTELFSGFSSNSSKNRSIGIRGENGSGKTTLAKILSNSLSPHSGEALLTVSAVPANIALVDQFPERMLGVSTLQDFMDQLKDHGKMDSYHMSTCTKVMQSHQISWETVKDRHPFDLPWNLLRLAIIIMLANCNYDILILDEPTFGLGADQTRKMTDYFHEIMSSKHLVFISHDSNFLDEVCDSFIDLSVHNISQKSILQV